MKSLSKDDSNWEEGKRAFGFLLETVTQCIDKGYFKGMEPEVLSFTLWSMVHGICSLEIRQRCSVVSEANQENLARKAGNMVIEMLNRIHTGL